jgi:plastocyanin
MRIVLRSLAFSALILAAACGGSGDASTGGSGSPTGPTTPTTPTATNAVTVSDFQFSPANIQVSTGATVTWTWASGSTTHNVTFSDGTASPDLASGATYSRTFNTAGTFSYRCTIHSSMQASVLVM